MKSAVTLLAFLLIATSGGCDKTPETLVKGGYDQDEMDAAMKLARSEVDDFIAEMSEGNGEDFAVKAPVEDDGTTEHFWLIDLVVTGDSFEGTINNDPGMVSNVKIGQKLKIAKTEISDWMYMRDGKMYGNYTLRPLLATMPDEQAEQLRAILAAP